MGIGQIDGSSRLEVIYNNNKNKNSNRAMFKAVVEVTSFPLVLSPTVHGEHPSPAQTHCGGSELEVLSIISRHTDCFTHVRPRIGPETNSRSRS